MIAVDANFLPLLLGYPADIPEDPATGLPISNMTDRIQFLIERCDEANETFIIPTPVLSEFLVLAKKDGNKYLDKIERSPLYEIKAFGKRAAIELAAIRIKAREKISGKERKRQDAQGTWAKISFDRQLVAIAKTYKAHTIYSDDKNVRAFAIKLDMKVIRTYELPEPPTKAQMEMFAAPIAEATDEGGLSESGS